VILKPLQGLRVLDFSRYLPGPYLTRILYDFGADVIKIEDPSGDPLRYIPPVVDGQGAAFSALNWGKRSLCIDLKQKSARLLLLEMTKQVDILVESFRPGVMKKLGLDYDLLKTINPRLIFCSLSGYGQTSNKNKDAGHDLNYLAQSGLLALMGPANDVPQTPGVQIADVTGSLWGVIQVLLALLNRQNVGVGQALDISLTHAAMSYLALELARRLNSAPEGRGHGLLTGGLPAYRVYETQDGFYFALAALEPKFFINFCERAQCQHLVPHGLSSGDVGQKTMRELEELFLSKSKDEWLNLLEGFDCCCELVIEPETAAQKLIHEKNDTQPFILWALQAFGQKQDIKGVPQLGEHTHQVLRELQIQNELVDQAVAANALVGQRS